MVLQLKPLAEQVLVLTGATSGIGLVTARAAAKAGAKLVLAARNQQALNDLCYELENVHGTETLGVAADVGTESDVRSLADKALERFGTFDTWVNDAGVSIYGNLADVSTEDSRRLFDTNFWGVVYGSLAAAKHLRVTGGALINIGSTLSDRAIPIQGMYCASKHAVKGFTDALRMELEAEAAPVSVTLIKPAAVDTPYRQHAKNYLETEPVNPPPVYAPETVANTILYCAENPVRDVFVGAGGKMLAMMGEYAPRLTDVYMEKVMIDSQKGTEPAGENWKEGLYSSADNTLTERGGYTGHVAESSLYTTASLHPIVTGAAALAIGAGVGYLVSRGSGSSQMNQADRTH
jgi:short-subunit dehydrogenase